MFASLAVLAAVQQIVVPLGNPKQIEQPRAPIEIAGPEYAVQCTDADDKPAPPVRIFGNTYLVGTCGASSILITDPAGDILIDGGTDADADLIAANIRRLGFSPTDVKFILNSGEDSTRVGGIAKLQRLTGARVLASPAAAAALNSGNALENDPQYGSSQAFAPVHVDQVVQDGEQVRIGNTILIATATPGHTLGGLTWHWGSCQGGVCRQIVYADNLAPVSGKDYRFSGHPEYLAAYRASIARVAALPCDILLTPQPSASDLADRLALGKPLEDPDACRAYAAAVTSQLDQRLAREAAAK